MIDLADGAVPPAVPEKLRLVGLKRMLGVGADVPPVTINVTGTEVTCGFPLLPSIEIITLPLYVPAGSPVAFTCTVT